MKYLDEYRDEAGAQVILNGIAREVEKAAQTGALGEGWSIMEVCGGQTHTLIKSGIDRMLPAGLTLVHGPGCPVCVTSLETIDRAVAIATRREVIFTSFGDMLRVPGSISDLLSVKARGGDVRMVYSPLDALKLAQENPDREVVFFAVGFETTAPGNAMAVWQAHQLGLRNFSILNSHVRVPPAIEAIMGSPESRVNAFLAAGHVCAVMGYWEYEPLADRYAIPIVVTGFEPLDLLQGIYMATQALAEGRHKVENQYGRVVTRAGNIPAQRMLEQVFQVCDQTWRGIGSIPQSGFCLRPELAAYDAAQRFDVGGILTVESPLCIAGEVLRGVKKPNQCAAFGVECTPQHPLGAPMVSGEGACAAYYAYTREPI